MVPWGDMLGDNATVNVFCLMVFYKSPYGNTDNIFNRRFDIDIRSPHGTLLIGTGKLSGLPIIELAHGGG